MDRACISNVFQFKYWTGLGWTGKCMLHICYGSFYSLSSSAHSPASAFEGRGRFIRLLIVFFIAWIGVLSLHIQ